MSNEITIDFNERMEDFISEAKDIVDQEAIGKAWILVKKLSRINIE